MKKIAVIAIAFAMLVSASVYAADIFVRPKPAQPAPTYDSSPDYIPNPNASDIPPPAPVEKTEPRNEEPVTIEDFSKRYYDNCMKQTHPVLKGQNLQMMCGCTAEKVQSKMSVEQMTLMKEDNEQGQFERNRMLLFVYAPCIEYPTRALILDQCMNNQQIKGTLKNYKQTCGCLGDGMAAYMKEKAPAAIQDAISRNVNNFDPLRTLLESPEFNNAQQQMLQACVMKHELGQ